MPPQATEVGAASPIAPGTADVQDPSARHRDSGSTLGKVLASMQADGIATAADRSIMNAPVSGEFDRGFTADGVLKLLRGFDAVLFFDSRSGAAPRLSAVWVYPQGQSRERVGARAAGPTRAPEAPAALSAPPDPAALERELASPDASVRRDAFAKSFEFDAALPRQALQQVARADADAELRALALQALARHASPDDGSARATLQSALSDTDSTVRERARELLKALELAALPAESLPLSSADP